MEELINYSKSEEFKSIREACEQNFHAHVLLTLRSGSVTKSEMVQGYKKQANEILSDALEEHYGENEDEEVLCTNITTNNFTGDDENGTNLLAKNVSSSKKIALLLINDWIYLTLFMNLLTYIQKKSSKKRKDCEKEEECSSVLFDEKNEATLIESIDEKVK